MAKEIERKFLWKQNYIKKIEWGKASRESQHILQGYLFVSEDQQVRIRRIDIGIESKYFMTIKYGSGLSREEIEFEVPEEKGKILLYKNIGELVSKTRLFYEYNGKEFSYDYYGGDNLEGLKIIEVELESEDEKILLPPWIGEEVTDDKRYSNVNLAMKGYPLDN